MDLIIGAGISGLSYANFCGHNDYIIIDKEIEIGGYCKTIRQDGFTWDYSGHFFHFRNKKIKEYLLTEMQGQEILNVEKNTQIFYKNQYIDFPFQKNIHQLEKQDFIDCLYDLFENNFQDESTFKKMLYTKFGKSIADKFLIPYNEKIYACDLNDLDANAMGRFFPYANKEEIIKNFRNPENTSYNTHFTYPKGGAIEYVNSLFKRVDSSKVFLGEKLISVDLINKIATTNKREIKYDKLISSTPFPYLMNLCSLDYDKTIYSWNKVLVFNLGFNKKGIDKTNHWVYFPEKKYSFYRIGYYDNIFDDDRLSLYVELGFDKNELVCQEDYLPIILADLKKANIITDHELISYANILMDPAYVHVNEDSENDKIKKMNYLESKHIYSIGRYGDWKYCSIEDNIIEAKDLAKKLSNNYKNE
jgi:protoporphyrinogen oxidase|tara:strand:- start:9942 stop:11195 length:1254 start_codon:yes stop_codon:yes gene_type:complete